MSNKKNKRITTTQLAATPTLKGLDAQRLLVSLEKKSTEKSKENSLKLVSYFDQNITLIPKVKPIEQTPEITGEFAKDILKEVMTLPSATSIERNKKAQELLRRMKR